MSNKKERDITTEQKILEVATEVFQQKGYAGARMQDIADKAQINRAMLHYYYRNKEKLFEGIFQNAFQKLIPSMNEVFDADLPLFDKIRQVVNNYITLVFQNRNLPLFVLHELQQNPEKFVSNFFVHHTRPNPAKLIQQIQEEIKAGNIRPIMPQHLVMNMMSLCIFPFVSQPVFQQVFQIGDAQYEQFLESRKTEVAEFIIESIKVK
ncbi:MAG TPA: TetR/AcrR family transcriptional regulator [Microscillaceae bacterium]|nr:TetR/AcrR family transcriptional regulator [Microscillaceae bacterium]